MYGHTFVNLQFTRSDIRSHIKLAVSLVIPYGYFDLPQGLCGYVWVNITPEGRGRSDGHNTGIIERKQLNLLDTAGRHEGNSSACYLVSDCFVRYANSLPTSPEWMISIGDTSLSQMMAAISRSALKSSLLPLIVNCNRRSLIST